MRFRAPPRKIKIAARINPAVFEKFRAWCNEIEQPRRALARAIFEQAVLQRSRTRKVPGFPWPKGAPRRAL